MSDPNHIIRQNSEVQPELPFQIGGSGRLATTLNCKHCRSDVMPTVLHGKCQICFDAVDFVEISRERAREVSNDGQ
jgi:hypothetical protein